MPYGLIHYNAPGDTLEEFLDFAAQAGFDCVEIQIGDLWPKEGPTPEERTEQVAAMLRERGLFASAISAGNNFCVDQEEEIRAQVLRMRRICDLAQILGTDTLRTEGGWPGDDPRPAAEWVPWIAECLGRCLEFIEPLGMKLAVDNHGYITNEWPIQLMVYERVQSPLVGANLDTMNYRWFGHSVEKLREIYEAIAPHVLHTHLKDGTGARQDYKGCALGEGEIPLNWAVECLKKAGYSGPWVAEYEGPRDDGTGYRKCLAWMKANC